MKNLKNIVDEIIFFLKYTYLVFVLVLLLYLIIELKTLYRIDIFESIDSPIDNFYYDLKDDIYRTC